MKNKENSSSEIENKERKESIRKDYLLALIEHGSRPFSFALIGLFVVLFLVSIKEPLFEFLNNAQELKVGSFELRLRVNVDQYDLNKEFRALETLNNQQIQLFLVVGRGGEHITYIGEEVTEKNLNELSKVGLFSEVKQKEDGSWFWRLSEKGIRLHDLIFQQVVMAIGGRNAS